MNTEYEICTDPDCKHRGVFTDVAEYKRHR